MVGDHTTGRVLGLVMAAVHSVFTASLATSSLVAYTSLPLLRSFRILCPARCRGIVVGVSVTSKTAGLGLSLRVLFSSCLLSQQSLSTVDHGHDASLVALWLETTTLSLNVAVVALMKATVCICRINAIVSARGWSTLRRLQVQNPIAAWFHCVWHQSLSLAIFCVLP